MSDVLRSLANPAGLARIVESEWDVPVKRVTLHRCLVNDIYIVDPGYFLKVYRHGWRFPEEVAWECELTEHLICSGVSVAPVIRRPDGLAVGIWDAPEGPRPMVLSKRQDGRPPSAPFTAGLHRAHGRLVAQMHVAGDSFASTRSRRHRDLAGILEEPLAQVLPLLSVEDRDMVAELAALSRDGLTAGRPTRGVCHGDATMDNVLISGGTDEQPELVLLDFDAAGRGFTAMDFPYGEPNMAEFLAGYSEVRPVTADDLAAGPYLNIARLITNLRFHLVIKPAWRGVESMAEGWLARFLTELRGVRDRLETGR